MSSKGSCYASNTYTSYSNWLSNRLNVAFNANRSNSNSSLSSYSNSTSTAAILTETPSLDKRKSIDFRRPSTSNSMFFSSKTNNSNSIMNMNTSSSIDFNRDKANKLRAKAKANIGALIGKKIQIFKLDQVLENFFILLHFCFHFNINKSIAFYL
jgi:hypothetical protein